MSIEKFLEHLKQKRRSEFPKRSKRKKKKDIDRRRLCPNCDGRLLKGDDECSTCGFGREESREPLKRPCMKCRKQFLPRYKYHTICGNCKKANATVGGINVVPCGSFRHGVTPGGNK